MQERIAAELRRYSGARDRGEHEKTLLARSEAVTRMKRLQTPQDVRRRSCFSHRLTPPTPRASAGTSTAGSSCATERSSHEHGVRRQAYHRAALLLEHRVEIVHHVTRHRIDVAKRALERIVQGMSAGAGGLR